MSCRCSSVSCRSPSSPHSRHTRRSESFRIFHYPKPDPTPVLSLADVARERLRGRARGRERRQARIRIESNTIATHEAKQIFPNLPESEAESYYRTRSRTSRATVSAVALTRTRTLSGQSRCDQRPRQASGGASHARSDQGGGIAGGVYWLRRESGCEIPIKIEHNDLSSPELSKVHRMHTSHNGSRRKELGSCACMLASVLPQRRQ